MEPTPLPRASPGLPIHAAVDRDERLGGCGPQRNDRGADHDPGEARPAGKLDGTSIIQLPPLERTRMQTAIQRRQREGRKAAHKVSQCLIVSESVQNRLSHVTAFNFVSEQTSVPDEMVMP